MAIALSNRGKRTIVRTDRGPSRQASLLVTSALTYASSYIDAYGSLLQRYLNFRMHPDEPIWTCLFESDVAVRSRVIRFAEKELELTLTPTGIGDGSFYVSRRNGPVNYYMRAFSVITRLYDELRSPKFRHRSGANPLRVKNYDDWTPTERAAYLVQLYGPENAKHQLANGGTRFIARDTRRYPPSRHDPNTLAARIYTAVRALLGDHSITNLTCVNRDDGQRWGDINKTTFKYYDLEFEIWGENKCSPEDEHGKRPRDKLVGMSEEARDGIHRTVDARHAANPKFPSMAQLREWKSQGNDDELDRWFVFFQPATNKCYSYPGYHRLEVKATSRANVMVYRLGKLRPATSNWQRRSLHEREYLRIHRDHSDLKTIKYLEQKLSDERGHRTPQHKNYASSARIILARETKFARIAEDVARQKGLAAPARALAGQSTAVTMRQKARRSPNGVRPGLSNLRRDERKK